MWPNPITWSFDLRWATTYGWPIVTMRTSGTIVEIWRFKDNGVTTLTFWGHVTLWVTWPFDSRWATTYWWSIVTMRLSCTVKEIWSLKLPFAHVKSQKFAAHAPCHVTCMQGVQNDRIFEIPEAILPIHYATFVKLRRRLRVVCRWAFPLLSIFSRNSSKSENGPKICGLGDLEAKNIKRWMLRPPWKSIFTETRHLAPKYGDAPVRDWGYIIYRVSALHDGDARPS